VDEAKQAKKKLDDAAADIQKRLEADNNLKGQLEDVTQQKNELQAQLDAAMSTPRKAPTEAEKAADPLVQWAAQKAPQP
jgi:chromosome segregation ATPase